MMDVVVDTVPVFSVGDSNVISQVGDHLILNPAWALFLIVLLLVWVIDG